MSTFTRDELTYFVKPPAFEVAGLTNAYGVGCDALAAGSVMQAGVWR